MGKRVTEAACNSKFARAQFVCCCVGRVICRLWVDVGENYGYAGLFRESCFPGGQMILGWVHESWLNAFIEHNFAANAKRFDALH